MKKTQTLIIETHTTPEEIAEEIFDVIDGPVKQYMLHVFNVLAKYRFIDSPAFYAVKEAFEDICEQ